MKGLLRIVGVIAICLILASKYMHLNSIFIDVFFVISMICFVLSGSKR